MHEIIAIASANQREETSLLVGLRVSRGLVVAKQASSRWLLDLSSRLPSLFLYSSCLHDQEKENETGIM